MALRLQRAKAYLRQRGGVNLRNPWGVCLAEVQTLCCIPLLLAALWLLFKLLALVAAVIMLPHDEAEHSGRHHAHNQGAQRQSHVQSFEESALSAAVEGGQSSSFERM